jgi:ubiquinol-cytochrome c reductase iron-sulfur subunit
VAAAFGLSALSSIALAILYLRGGQPQWEGTLLFLSLGGLAVGFILWGKHLLPQGPYVQPREPLPSTAAERAAFEEDFEQSAEAVQRRAFLARMVAVALGAFGLAAVFPIRSLGPKPGRSLFQTSWRKGTRVVTEQGLPVRVGDVQPGGILTVFPEGHTAAADSQTLLINVGSELRALPGRQAWSPDGLVAYSKICTHAGCPVGLYEAASQRLFCPCHQSVFDVLDGARPLAGPATRPLPQLPLTLDPEGFVTAQSDYPEPVGPGFWNEP